MDLFSKGKSKANPEKIKQIKNWIYQVFEIDEQIIISLNQLQCTEPGCPPLETVIVIMDESRQPYKIHKSIAEIEREDILKLQQR
ncbi:hypothetical protein HC931_12400 [Candidatus Gracilibacteria bacterium]|nr:hypothetical protein [Candidatus Gracilibacteria bacterium]NJP21473.1 hypothetical protein [Hydrococcus sp. CRU_1_1]